MVINSSSLTPGKFIPELRRCGITHIVWVPDSSSHFICEAVSTEPDFTLIPVCREGEAIPIAVGLLLGGKKPIIVHQNTGLFDSGDSIRFALDLDFPLLMLIGYRGWQYGAPPTDSPAIYTEPILDAWGVKHYLVRTDADIEKVSRGYEQAQKTHKPVVILLGRS